MDNLEENYGFAGGCNEGIRVARGSLIATLNNDTEVEPDWLRALVEAMDDNPSLGMCASKILFAGDRCRIDKVGHLMYMDGLNHGRGSGQLDTGQFDFPEEVLFPDAAAAIYRKDMLDAEEIAQAQDLREAHAYQQGTQVASDLRITMRRNANISEDERNSWPAISDGFLAFALAAKRLFIAGEEIFLAADANGWLDSCKSFFGPMGMSYPISSTELDSNGGIELKFTEIPLLSLTAGFLAGAWVRCEGRPVKVAIREEDNFTFISLQTRYELN